ncbi:hypothetical protein CVT26_011865 [Gymnopilus dilepis]|uniref:Uncharacterized protein n=1 Tax=Gymnopilus dilepis TaxID=231916 RepID=A0A409W5J3_9AGAR|nr:hypothetical protein CVT26_011865 [Gymnopilus dilepis]
MTISLPRHNMPYYPKKHIRRSATAVMAGNFDPLPPRDVLTSLLNGVGPYREVEKEKDPEAKKKRKEEKRERKRARTLARLQQQERAASDAGRHATVDSNIPSSSSLPHISISTPSNFWRVGTSKQHTERPTIHIPAQQRSVSVTPSPTTSTLRLPSTPGSTPGPSMSSSTSRTSSKRPRTPDDDELMHAEPEAVPQPPRPRKKRAAARKGWKGWVEGSPPPSDKLINLDAVPLLQERRTRSGKNFDAISIGKDGWV